MPMIRASALRSLRFAGARASVRASAGRTQLVAKRFASSGGSHGHAESGSDLPWLLGAVAITPPACWYLWPDTTHAEHGDHGHHEEHAEEEEKPSEDDQSKEDEAPQEESAPAEQADEPEKTEEKAQQSSEKPEEKSEGDDEKSEGGDDKQAGGEKESKDDSGSTEQGQDEKSQEGTSNNVGKGKMKADSEGHNAVHKSEPNSESRGTGKRRIDSGLGRNIGEGDENSQATAKPTPKDPGDMANKQAGMSNTDTRHSHKDEELAPLSSKGSGQLDTAKAKGTVDPSQPAKGPGGSGKAAEKKPTGEDN